MDPPKQIAHKLHLGDSAEPGIRLECEEWVAAVRRRSHHRSLSTGNLRVLLAESSVSSASPGCCSVQVDDLGKPDDSAAASQPSDQVPEISLRDRLGNAAILDIEATDVSWETLFSLHHIKHTSSSEYSEDEMNKALEVTVNSGGVIFFALFNTVGGDELSTKEAVAVIKIASSRMATQSERMGYEFAKLLAVKTPQARVIHNSSTEWQLIKDAAEKARELAVANGDEQGEVTCSELLEALELSRCLFLMNYVDGSPLVESTNAFDSREAAESTAASLGRVFMLDLILRNEDRLPCPQLGWRGNPANLLFSNKFVSGKKDALDEAYDSVIRRYKPRIVKGINKERKKERRAISVNGRLDSQGSALTPVGSDDCINSTDRSTNNHGIDGGKGLDFHIVAIDSGVPRRPPAGKRTRDQENYPKVVELIINNTEFCSNLLYEVSFGKLGFPGPEQSDATSDSCSYLSETDMIAVVHAFRAGFRGALRDLQSFHIFLFTLYQKLEGLLRIFQSILNKIFGESDKDDSLGSESPSNSAWSSYNSQFQACRERNVHDANSDFTDSETRRSLLKSSGSRENIEATSPGSRDNWNGRNFRAIEAPRNLRLTMKLRDFNKLSKVDAELSKELEQWNELVREDVVKLCQENNFNTGFFEGNDSNIAVDAYELKVRLEHILERISLISDAASTERPSPVTDYLYIGGALAAKSMFTLRHLGITHILCLCANEIGQSDSQNPEIFEYQNFSVSDNDEEDISGLFEEASHFIDYVEKLGGKILVHCFEGKSRSATVVLAYLMLRKGFTLLEAWNKLKKVHRRAQPNDGFAKILQDLDKQLHGKTSMEWQQRKPMMKVCPICGKDAGLSSSSLKLHLQKSHRMLSSGSVDSAMTLEIQKAVEALQINRCGSISPTQKHRQPQPLDDSSH
ncbi:dual specificity protein phosphatase PHS1-like [Canna indica]|uniref:Dual specificity protein phosphatase PHS1-like n=1 Tax=Canna indica TaxID=4628 RepID=A0AAQ3KPU1_9LILI|nr:dual specificity protein phosphatase PHS1-like [Canna indica]